MKSDYRIRAQKFCRLLYNFIADCHDIEDFDRAISKFNRTYHRSVQLTHGISRVVFITSDYVIKIDAWESDWGNCEDEVEVYKEAKLDGYEYLFAEITPFYYLNHAFYIMPRINVMGYTKEYSIDEYLNWDEWNYLSHKVNDLHDFNWGMKNGHVVVFDYACKFNEEDY